jgi:hypothetical protein
MSALRAVWSTAIGIQGGADGVGGGRGGAGHEPAGSHHAGSDEHLRRFQTAAVPAVTFSREPPGDGFDLQEGSFLRELVDCSSCF